MNMGVQKNKGLTDKKRLERGWGLGICVDNAFFVGLVLVPDQKSVECKMNICIYESCVTLVVL